MYASNIEEQGKSYCQAATERERKDEGAMNWNYLAGAGGGVEGLASRCR